MSAANNCVLCSQHHVQRKLLPVRCTSYCRSAVTNSLSMLRFVPISHTLQHSLIGRLFLVWKIFLAQESGIANMNVRATVCMYVCKYHVFLFADRNFCHCYALMDVHTVTWSLGGGGSPGTCGPKKAQDRLCFICFVFLTSTVLCRL